MKKLLAILLALSLVLSFAACGKGETSDGEMDGKGDKATANEDSATVPDYVKGLSEEDLVKKYEAFMSFLDTEDAAEAYVIFSEEMMKIDGIDDDSLTPIQGFEKFEKEIKDAFVFAFDGYVAEENLELYAEFFFITMKITMLFEDADFQEKMEEKGVDLANADGKEKLTELVKEYIPEWFVDSCFGTVIDEIATNATTKTCAANRREILSQVNTYFMSSGVVPENVITITIEYTGDEPAVKIEGSGITVDEFNALFQEVPFCPTGGTYVVTVKPAIDEYSMLEIEVTCDAPNHNF